MATTKKIQNIHKGKEKGILTCHYKKKKKNPSTNGDSNAGNDRQKTKRHI